MHLALMAFQAWQHYLYFGPQLPVFTMENMLLVEDVTVSAGYKLQIRLQFPNETYEKTMGRETLDTNVLQLADVFLAAKSLQLTAI